MTTTATDLAGNSLTDVTTVELLIALTARAAPTIDEPIEDDDIINATEDDDAAITGTGEPNTTLTLIIDDGNSLTPPVIFDVIVDVIVDAMGIWTVPVAGLDLSGLDDGPLTVSAFTADAAGNISPTATATPLHDTVTEPVVITGPVEDDDIVNEAEAGSVLVTGTIEPNSTVTVSISDGVNPPVEIVVTTDPSGNWTIAGREVDLSGLDEGLLTITATAVDEAGNLPSIDTHDIVLNTIAPAIDPLDTNTLTIDTPIEGDNTANDAEDNDVLLTGTAEPNSIVTLTVSDPSVLTVIVTATTDPMGVWTIVGDELDLSPFDQGTRDVSATATDLAGNTNAPVTSSFTLDTTPPQALAVPDLLDGSDTGDTPTDNLTNNNTPTFSGPAGAGEPGSTVTLYIDGEPIGTAIVNEDGSYSVDVPSGSPLSDGERLVTVTFTDVPRNEGPQSPLLTIIVDTTESVTPTTPQTLPDMLKGTGEPGTKITMLDKNGDPVVDTNGNPIVTTASVDEMWTLTGMFPPLGFQDTVTVISTGGAGTFRSSSVIIACFGFDSFNNLSQTPSRFMSDTWSDSEILHSRLLLDLGSNPILSGVARPGTLRVARLYSVDGSILAEESVVADAAGNWMLQLHGILPSDAPRIVIEHLSTSQVPPGSSGFRLSNQAYSHLQVGTTYGYQSTANGLLGATAGEALSVDHSENLNPLNWL